MGVYLLHIWRAKQKVESFVTSSGTATDLETYDFGYKTSLVSVAAVFSEPGQSIAISEVRTALSDWGWTPTLAPSRKRTPPPEFRRFWDRPAAARAAAETKEFGSHTRVKMPCFRAVG